MSKRVVKSWVLQEARGARARRCAQIEAALLWTGHNPWSAENVRRLGLLFRPKEQIPHASYLRWRCQKVLDQSGRYWITISRPEAQALVNEELLKLAEKNGLGVEAVLKRIADLPDKVEELGDAKALIESVKMQARLIGAPVDEPRAMSRRALHHAQPDFEEVNIEWEPAARGELPAHDADYDEVQDIMDNAPDDDEEQA